MGMFGMMQDDDQYWKPLTAADVNGIQTKGGSVLGTDKAPFEVDKAIANL